MTRLREEYDANQAENAMLVSDYPTENAQFGVYCDMCGEQFFVDEITFERVNHAILEGFDNPFVCEGCRDELGESAYFER